MKLAPRTFRIWWDVHAWAGVIASLLVFMMFFAGGFALFRRPLDRWSEPCHSPVTSYEQLARAIPTTFSVEPDGHVHVDGRVQCGLTPVDEGVGTFMYQLHHLDMIPYGHWISGLGALVLALVIVTGLVIQLKDRVRTWFRFRPEKGLRVGASDLHKLLGIIGVPFQLIYAWSGVMLCLGAIAIDPIFERAGLSDGAAVIERPKPVARSRDLDAIVASSRDVIPGFVPTNVVISEAAVGLEGDIDGVAFGTGRIQVRRSDGAITAIGRPSGETTNMRADEWMTGLHFGRYGGTPMKIVLAVFAALTCIVTATGTIVWLERRDRRRQHRANRWLAKLTLGWCAGLVLATIALFATGSQLVFGLVWLASVIAQAARR
ncbi:MAG: PepSY-associated TM helix domain-containing protein [Kofleriaceae bacterium]